MKTLIKAAALLLVTCFVLSSCNSSLSFTKRRYSRGYYVHKAGHAGQPIEKISNKQQQIHFNTVSPPEAVASENADVPAENVGITPQSSPAKRLSAGLNNNSNSLKAESFITDPVKSFKSLSKTIASADTSSDALSLLWILAVILLIAYIVGLLMDNFGLGWVIHILLVAALVILILWLLKII